MTRIKLKKYSKNRNYTFYGTLAKKNGQNLLIKDVYDFETKKYITDHMWIHLKKNKFPHGIKIGEIVKFKGNIVKYIRINNDEFDEDFRDWGVGTIKQIERYES